MDNPIVVPAVWLPFDPKAKNHIRLIGRYEAQCFDPLGRLKWSDRGWNLVVNAGLQHLLDVVLDNGSAVYPWYVGLVDGTVSSTTYAAGDTLGSHAGWSENANYTGNRQAYDGTRSSQTMTNSASKASFTIDTNGQTIAGAFLCSVASGTSGTLFSAADFSGGEKSADQNDVLEVTYEITATSS